MAYQMQARMLQPRTTQPRAPPGLVHPATIIKYTSELRDGKDEVVIPQQNVNMTMEPEPDYVGLEALRRDTVHRVGHWVQENAAASQMQGARRDAVGIELTQDLEDKYEKQAEEEKRDQLNVSLVPPPTPTGHRERKYNWNTPFDSIPGPNRLHLELDKVQKQGPLSVGDADPSGSEYDADEPSGDSSRVAELDIKNAKREANEEIALCLSGNKLPAPPPSVFEIVEDRAPFPEDVLAHTNEKLASYTAGQSSATTSDFEFLRPRTDAGYNHHRRDPVHHGFPSPIERPSQAAGSPMSVPPVYVNPLNAVIAPDLLAVLWDARILKNRPN